MRSGKLPWELAFALLAGIWGTSFLFIKIAGRDLSAVGVAGGRAALGAAAIGALCLAGRHALPRGRRTWAHLVVAAFLLNALPFLLLAWGERKLPSGAAGLWNATTPLVAATVAIWLLPRERLGARGAAGIVAGFAGAVVMAAPWSSASGPLAGHLLCAGTAISYGVGTPYAARFIRTEGSIVGLTFAQLTIATVQIAVVALALGAPVGHVTRPAAASMLGLGVLGTGIAYLLYHGLVRRVAAATVASVTYVVPVVAVLLGILALGESPSYEQLLGGALVLTGIAIVRAANARREAGHDVRAEPLPILSASPQTPSRTPVS